MKIENLLMALGVLLLPLPLASQVAVPPHPDNSVDTETYMDMRIPDPRLSWSLDDYLWTIKILKKLKGLDKYTLPRRGNQDSGQLFRKITDPILFKALIDSTASLEQRLLLADKYASIPNDLLSLYKEPFFPTERFGKEVISCYRFIAEFSEALIILVDELIEKIGELYAPPELLELKKNVQTELYNILLMELEVLDEEKNRFDIELQKRFAAELTDQFPKFFHLLTDELKQLLIAKMERIAKARSEEKIQEAFTRTLKILKN